MRNTPVDKLISLILKQGLVYIDDAVTGKMTENYYLEFKTTEQDDYSEQRKLFNKDKKNYAKSISAFGNSDGGVVIWGIATGASDADYASEKKPIKNVSNFKTLLESFTSLVTSPPHPNVSNTIIFEDQEKDVGYVVTHINRSSRRPFQVIYENDFRYYIRAGSSSSGASDTFLRSLFGQSPQPDVFINFWIAPVEIDMEGTVKIKAGIILHNAGESVAKNLNGYVHVGGVGMAIEVGSSTANDFTFSQNTINGMKIGFVAKNEYILGIEQEVLPLTVHIDIKKPIGEFGIQIIALVSCDNQMTYRISKRVTKEELEFAYDSYIIDNKYPIENAIFGTETSATLDE